MLCFPSQPERSEWFEDRIFQNWLGMRDSNPRWRSQSPLPYRLANPQRSVPHPVLGMRGRNA